MLKKMQLGVKVSISIALIIVIFISIINLFSSSQTKSGVLALSNASMLNNVKDNAQIISSNLKIYENDVKLSASRTRVQSMDWSQARAVLTADAKTDGFIEYAFIKTDGSMVTTTGGSANVSARAYFKSAMDGKTVISDPLISKVTGKLIIPIVTPIRDSSGKIVGALGGTLDGSILSNLSKNIKGSESGYGFIVNGQGTYIGNDDQTQVDKEVNIINDSKKDNSYTSLATLISTMIKGSNGTSQFASKGNNYFAAYAQIPNTTWSLSVVGNEKEIMASATKTENGSMLLDGIMMLAAIIMTLILMTILVSRPLKKTVKVIEEYAKGHLKDRLPVKSGDEIGKMSAAMNELADILQNNLLGTMKKISVGDMDTHVEFKDEKDEIAPVLKTTIDTVKSISEETRRIIAAAKNGDLSQRCASANYNGSWAALTNEINGLMDSIATPVGEVQTVMKNISVNDYTTKIEGSYSGVFAQLADSTNGLCDRLLGLQGAMVSLASGDTSALANYEKVGKRSANDHMSPAIVQMMRSINNLVEEVKHLTQESLEGNILSARGDSSKFEGGYKVIVEGFNKTLEAVSKPLTETLDILEIMSNNDYTKSVSENYKGDYLKMAQAVNNVQTRLMSLQNVAVKVSSGDISELDNFKAIGSRSKNDHIIPAFIHMMESIKQLIDETKSIAESASEGNLTIRGDVSKFSGEFKNIIFSINHLLDEVGRPVGEVTRIMSDIADSKFDVSIQGEFKGGFKLLVDSVNTTAKTLNHIITEVTGIIEKMANGNFSIKHVSEFKGDFKTISTALNSILDSLNDLFGNIRQTAEQVAAGSSQVSDGSQSLSQGTAEQSSSVEELTASMAEIAETTKNNAKSGSEANKLVGEVKGNAASGSNQMNEMLKSMNDISESSKNISKIIKVIDDIAFQTNILALNAAVEAARAGQHGKGFAVVAEEVRNLAGRSANATKETSELLDSTLAKVAGGTKLADETAKAFASIVSGIDKVANIISDISASSNEQATGISQINVGLEQVSKVVQTNAATSQQSAAASEELSSQANILSEQLSKFDLRK